jgi:MFS family permease
MNQNKLFGTIGIAGAAFLLVGIVIAVITFENGAFSLLNGFYSELGHYSGAYMGGSSALIFNVLMALFGLIMCVFMVFWGIRQASWPFGAAAFFGILTGVLAAAQAIFTLDYARYHYIVVSAFAVSAFLFGAAYIIAALATGRNNSLASVLVAFFAAICSAVYAGFVISGGMTQVFVEDASQMGRLTFIPFAMVGWLMLLLIMALLVLLSVELMRDRRNVRMVDFAERVRGHSREVQF